MAILKKTAIASALAVSLTATSVWAEGREAQMSENQVKQAMVSTQGSIGTGAVASANGALFPLIVLTVVMIAATTASGDPYAVVYPD